MSADGKQRNTDVADLEQMLRLIQSIPSPKAKPFKRCQSMSEHARVAVRGGSVAKVAKEAFEDQDPQDKE